MTIKELGIILDGLVLDNFKDLALIIQKSRYNEEEFI